MQSRKEASNKQALNKQLENIINQYPYSVTAAVRLLEQGADIETTDRNGNTILIKLCSDQPDLIPMILPFKPDVTKVQASGVKVVDLVRDSFPEVLPALADTYKDATSAQAIFKSFIELQKINFAAMAKLLENGADPQTKDINGKTLLELAKKEKNVAMVMQLSRFYPAVYNMVNFNLAWQFYKSASSAKQKEMKDDARVLSSVPGMSITDDML